MLVTKNIGNKYKLMATCLGFFFRQYPDYFKTIDGLVFGDGLKKFKEYVASHPEDLNKYINEKILPGDGRINCS